MQTNITAHALRHISTWSRQGGAHIFRHISTHAVTYIMQVYPYIYMAIQCKSHLCVSDVTLVRFRHGTFHQTWMAIFRPVFRTMIIGILIAIFRPIFRAILIGILIDIFRPIFRAILIGMLVAS